ncbi:MAG: ATP-binding protein [Chthonomonadales bacterium]
MAKRKTSDKDAAGAAKSGRAIDGSISEYEALLQRCGEGVIVLGQNGQVERLNQTAASLLHITTSAGVGPMIGDHPYPEDLGALYAEAVHKGHVMNREVRSATFKNSSMIVSIFPIRGKRGSRRRYLLISRDVTELRRLENIRRDFVANVSHELRTPLASIRAMAETLQDGALNDREVSGRFLGTIVTETERLTRIAQDLLILSDAESRQPERALLHMDNLITDVVERSKPQAEKAGIAFSANYPKGLDVMANHDQMEQVLVNLIDNAIKYTPEGGSVYLEAGLGKGSAIVSVTDTGIGMRKKDLMRIFERFYRVDKARSRQSGGTGLGLSIVKHIVESHGGHVSVESVPNEGSTFSFTIPLDVPTGTPAEE